MKEWFTAKELADLKLPAMPTSKICIIEKGKRESWKCRAREGRGGGKEYHISNLPEIARIQLAVLTAPAAKKEIVKEEINPQGLAEYAHIEGRAKSRIDAKLEILEAFKEFQTSLGFANTRARYIFAEKYNAGEVAVADWVKNTIVGLSACTLRNWAEVLANKGISGLAGKYGSRKGTGIIDTNEAVKNYILGAIYETPHVSCKNIMRGLRARFKETRDSLPSYRTLQDWVKTWKEDNEQLLTAVKNPDEWRSKYKAAAGSASESITRLNQEWQFDGTPSDLLLADGKRCNIVGIIDVYSRRLSLSVCDRASAYAVGCATRKAILKWGVPETVRTDNGKDYVADYIKRVFAALNIEQIICPPFNPQKKPHIERVFRTFSHSLLEQLDGFIGHNVTERKDIEARRSFSQRLFNKDETIELRLTTQELQEFCDNWCKIVYEREEHGSLGMTPDEKAASYVGTIRRIADERCLDVLLAKPAGKDGIRVVSKKGISYEGSYYNAPELGGHEGEQVRLLLDEQDYGELYAFDLDGKFLCKVISAENKGVSLEEVAAARSAVQKRALKAKKDALRRIAKETNLKGNEMVREVFMQAAEEAGKLVRLPSETTAYETEQMAEALKAAISKEPPKPTELSAAEQATAERLKQNSRPAEIVRLKPTPQQNFKRWEELKARFDAGDALDENESFFVETYPTTAEYKAQVFAAKCPKVLAGAI
ncbi:MAG: transposase [Alphaproteobacteria bacterium]|nr:transposase [Alphaproteobacteria bacterium]